MVDGQVCFFVIGVGNVGQFVVVQVFQGVVVVMFMVFVVVFKEQVNSMVVMLLDFLVGSVEGELDDFEFFSWFVSCFDVGCECVLIWFVVFMLWMLGGQVMIVGVVLVIGVGVQVLLQLLVVFLVVFFLEMFLEIELEVGDVDLQIFGFGDLEDGGELVVIVCGGILQGVMWIDSLQMLN